MANQPDVKIIILNGPPQVGKDTLQQELMKHAALRWRRCISYSSIDTVKAVAVQLGWDGKKNAKGRDFLARLKGLSIAYWDFPFQEFMQKFHKASEPVVILGQQVAPPPTVFFLHIREPSEIQKIQDTFPKETCTVLVLPEKDDEGVFAAACQSNESDYNVRDYDYRFTFFNNFQGTDNERYRSQVEELVWFFGFKVGY